MFPGLVRQDAKAVAFADMTRDLVAIEMAAHGGSVLEVKRENGEWRVVAGSRYARRIDADTPMEIAGPAAGHPRLRTAADPTGRKVLGTLNTCAGGITPWGTWLTCEESFHGCFSGKLADDHPGGAQPRALWRPGQLVRLGQVARSLRPRPGTERGEPLRLDRGDRSVRPGLDAAQAHRAWPLQARGGLVLVNRDGRVVVYSGDDGRYEHVYRFVSRRPYMPGDRVANADLLDDGILSVARFTADGTLDWLPLVHGAGPLTAANGFASQADVVIEARRAADLVGATKMDRPEGIAADPRTQRFT